MTITEALRVEHAWFRSLFDGLESELPEMTLKELKRISGVIESLIIKHGMVETDTAFAALNHALAEKGQIEKLQLEHRELGAAFYALKQASRLKEAGNLFKAVIKACRLHFEEEEQVVFPLMEGVLPAKVLKELGCEYLLPTRKPLL